MATDGTGIKVIVPKLPAAHGGSLEFHRNDEVAVLQYEPIKDGDLVTAKLRPLRGPLTALPRRPSFCFTDDPLVPGDNSPTEREFQSVAKLRLNMLFADST
jgi:hypothetical protein